MQDAYEALQALGFSEYDARAYTALVASSPANGYQVAKASGVPRAKVYESLERLVLRGAAVHVEPNGTGNESRRYAASDFNALMDEIERSTATACDRARKVLGRVERSEQLVEVLWRIRSEKDLIARAQSLVEGAQESLHLALWGEEFGQLFGELVAARKRGVAMGLIVYSDHPGIEALQKLGAGAVRHSPTKLDAIPLMGKQFAVVSDRVQCIVGSLFPDTGTVEGVYSMNRGILTNAIDLVNHEIYLERILLEVGAPVKRQYGEDLGGLDPFDPPAKPRRRR